MRASEGANLRYTAFAGILVTTVQLTSWPPSATVAVGAARTAVAVAADLAAGLALPHADTANSSAAASTGTIPCRRRPRRPLPMCYRPAITTWMHDASMPHDTA